MLSTSPMSRRVHVRHEPQREFHDALVAPITHGIGLPDDEHLVRYVDRSGAIVERDGSKQRAVLHSSFPLRTEDDNGDLAPTDLRLEERADGFETANAPVPVHVGKVLSQGIELPGGVALRPLGTAANSTATLVADRAFFANAAADTDAWVTPKGQGAEIFTQLRSPDAPEVQEYRVEMPDGAELRESDTRPGAVEVFDGSKVIAAITPPAAHDADARACR
jgi:hypothetical protein